jgi:RHS repeat-associated protein
VVDTSLFGSGGTPTTATTDYAYDDTEQTSETVTSGTPSSPGTIQSSQQYQYNLQGQMSGATVTTYTNGAVSQVEQLTYGYDTNGNRVSALDQIGPAAGSWTSQTLTEYLNDSNNQTGYTQLLRATQSDPTSGQLEQVTEYTIGLRQITQTTTSYTNGQPGTPTSLQFGYDGSGSVRVLLDAASAIATVAGVRQLFNYDAYGNAVGFNISQAATTLLYNAQQTDAATGLQYLRARYYNPGTGNFTSLDPFAGKSTSPLSYNKYLYTQGDPVNGYDPTGQDFSLPAALAVLSTAAADVPGLNLTNEFGSWKVENWHAEAGSGYDPATNTFNSNPTVLLKMNFIPADNTFNNIVFIQVVKETITDPTKDNADTGVNVVTARQPYYYYRLANGWRVDVKRDSPQGWYGYHARQYTLVTPGRSPTQPAKITDGPNTTSPNRKYQFITFAVNRDVQNGRQGQDGEALSAVSWGFTIDGQGNVVNQQQPEHVWEGLSLLEFAIDRWNYQSGLKNNLYRNTKGIQIPFGNVTRMF